MEYRKLTKKKVLKTIKNLNIYLANIKGIYTLYQYILLNKLINIIKKVKGREEQLKLFIYPYNYKKEAELKIFSNTIRIAYVKQVSRQLYKNKRNDDRKTQIDRFFYNNIATIRVSKYSLL